MPRSRPWTSALAALALCGAAPEPARAGAGKIDVVVENQLVAVDVAKPAERRLVALFNSPFRNIHAVARLGPVTYASVVGSGVARLGRGIPLWVTDAGVPSALAARDDVVLFAGRAGGAHVISRAVGWPWTVTTGLIEVGAEVRGVAMSDVHVFFTTRHGRLGRARLDGTDVRERWLARADARRGIVAVDGWVYWTDRRARAIGRARTDGSSADPAWVRLGCRPSDMSHRSGWLYATCEDSPHLLRVRRDGTGLDRRWTRVPSVTGLGALAPPDRPASLTAGSPGPRTVALSWAAAPGAGGYRIRRRTSGGAWTTVARRARGTTYADDGVAPARTYDYRVEAIGPGGWSTPAAVRVATPPPPPLQITALVLAPARFAPARRSTAVRASRRGSRLTVTVTRAAELRLFVRKEGRGRARPGWRPRPVIRRDVPAGTTSIPFTGRIEGSPLSRGRWRMWVTATADGTTTPATSVPFTIVR